MLSPGRAALGCEDAQGGGGDLVRGGVGGVGEDGGEIREEGALC